MSVVRVVVLLLVLLATQAGHAIGTVPGGSTTPVAHRCVADSSGTQPVTSTCVQPSTNASGIAACDIYATAYAAATSTTKEMQTTGEAGTHCQFGPSLGFSRLIINHTMAPAGGGACPANSTASGSSCTCNLNYRPNAAGTACETYSCLTANYGETVLGPYVSAPTWNEKYSCDTTGTTMGCASKLTREMTSSGPDGWYVTANEYSTGDKCQGTGTGGASPADAPGTNVPDTGTEPVHTCPSGQSPGTVNGTSVCVPSTSVSVPTETTINPDGTTTTKTTSCVGSQCTTNTVNKDATGATTSAGSTTESMSQFCAKNPGSLVCGGSSVVVGGTGTGGTGSGTGDGEEESCGLPDTPKCKIDETGTPTAESAGTGHATAGGQVDTKMGEATTAAEGIPGSESRKPTWTWSFQFPTGCTVLQTPAFAPYLTAIDVCQFQSVIHDLMSLCWIGAVIWGCISMVGRTLSIGGT